MLQKKYYTADQIIDAIAFLEPKAFASVINSLAKTKGADVIPLNEKLSVEDYDLRLVTENPDEPEKFIIRRW